MLFRRFVSMMMISAAIICLLPAQADMDDLVITRVFYLQGVKPLDAVSMLRQKIQVRRVAEYHGHELIVVTDSAARVDRSEALLREANSLARVVDPHAPLNIERTPEDQIVERSFSIKPGELKTATVLCRALYQIREITEDPKTNRLEIRDPVRNLDAVEALFRELNLLAEDS